MFRLNQSDTFETAVVVPVAGGEPQRFTGKFRRITQQRVEEILKEASEGNRTDADVLRDFMVGWSDVQGDSGSVEFSPDALTQALSIVGFAKATCSAYLEALGGMGRKN